TSAEADLAAARAPREHAPRRCAPHPLLLGGHGHQLERELLSHVSASLSPSAERCGSKASEAPASSRPAASRKARFARGEAACPAAARTTISASARESTVQAASELPTRFRIGSPAFVEAGCQTAFGPWP